MKNKITWLLWALLICCVLVNEMSYNYASLTKDMGHDTSIHSLAGCTGPISILCGTAKYVTAQEALIDQIAMYIGLVLIIAITIRARRKSKAPILFPPKNQKL